jgi:hypothetical protein
MHSTIATQEVLVADREVGGRRLVHGGRQSSQPFEEPRPRLRLGSDRVLWGKSLSIWILGGREGFPQLLAWGRIGLVRSEAAKPLADSVRVRGRS